MAQFQFLLQTNFTKNQHVIVFSVNGMIAAYT